MENVKKQLGNKLNYFDNKYSALENSCGLILVTGWGEFTSADFGKIKSLLRIPAIFDGRNLYDSVFGKANIRRLGFDYIGVGV